MTTMTKEQATQFNRFSLMNALTVANLLPCGCEPYKDVFTFKRWIAQGYCIKKGEHGIRIPVIGQSVKTDQTGQEITKKYFTNSAVFCRHQVVKLEPKK
jgi:hypothetical protein